MATTALETKTHRFLNNLLSSPYDVLRCEAVQAFSYLPGDQSVEAIVGALRDEDEDVRCDAISTLSHIADARAIPALIENLKYDPCGDVKVLAIQLLGQLKAHDMAPLLRALVTSRDGNGEIEWDEDAFFEDGWDDWIDIQTNAIVALGLLEDETAVDAVVSAMREEEGQDLSAVGCTALANMGEPGLAALIALIDGATDRLKRAIVDALSSASSPQAPAFLQSLIESPDPQLRLAALENLSTQKEQLALLKKLLNDPDPVVRANAYRLAQPSEQECVDLLLLGAADAVMIAALERLGAGDVLPPEHAYIKLFVHLLRHHSADVAAGAVAALAHRAGKATMQELETLVCDEKTPEPVLWSIVRSLRNVSSKRGIQILGDAARSKTREIRMEALASLQHRANSGSGTALGLLSDIASGATLKEGRSEPETVSDKNAEVRQQMSRSGLRTEASTETGRTSTLGAILGDEDIADRWIDANEGDTKTEPLTADDLALLALAERMPKKRKVSLEVTDGEADAETRRVAMRLLASCAGEGIHKILIGALDLSDEELCRSAADGLLLTHKPSPVLDDAELEAVSHLTYSANAELRRLGLEILATQSVDVVRPYLQKLLADPDTLVRSTAIKLSTRDDLPFADLSYLLSDAAPLVRSAAATAIAKSGDQETAPVLFDFIFQHGGFHCEEVAKLLHVMNKAEPIEWALKIMADEARKSDWAIGMEFLKASLKLKSMNKQSSV